MMFPCKLKILFNQCWMCFLFIHLICLFLQKSQAIHGAMKVLYFVTRQKRLLAASLIVFSTQHVTFRLVWVLTHYKQVRGRVN